MLLLNQSYEPLTICNVKKAIILILLHKAELVADKKNRKLRSISSTFPWPTVIRLKNYVNLPFKKIILSRKNIFKRDGHKCAYCGRGDLPLTVDHIIPRSRNGEDSWENLVAACLPCNSKKGDHLLEDVNMELLITPYRPNYIMFIKNSAGRLDSTWEPFLFQIS